MSNWIFRFSKLVMLKYIVDLLHFVDWSGKQASGAEINRQA
ncbi:MULTISPECIES: hypothetical protein [unclassified Bacillus (in: firmicutes)]|nr:MULTISPECIES: hypothetical protein [unclassified Bacillus (in: firmicutes)]